MSIVSINYKYQVLFPYIEKKLRFGFVNSSGRANNGKISVHHRGGGLKRRYLRIDYIRRIGCYGEVIKIIKTVFHTSLIGLIKYKNGLCNFIILSETNRLGSRLYSGSRKLRKDGDFKKDQGHALPIRYVKLFNRVNNIELRPYQGGSLMRAAKMSALISAAKDMDISLKLSNGWLMVVSKLCICTTGFVSYAPWDLARYKKAGFSRTLGIRPTVRGVAKNPCDHPHGGGNGKKSTPASPRSPWGWITKGPRTRTKPLTWYRRKYKGKRRRR